MCTSDRHSLVAGAPAWVATVSGAVETAVGAVVGAVASAASALAGAIVAVAGVVAVVPEPSALASVLGLLGGLPRLPLGRFFFSSIAASSSGVRT